jgi:TM2 domain-containing membrane protein YozV
MNCVNCGGTLQQGQSRCRKCGSVVEQATPLQTPPIQSAPGQLPVQVVIQTVPPPQASPVPQRIGPPRSRVAAGVLGILLGAFGVHRFYLGYTGIGVVQLLISVLTCGYGALISGLWGLIEGILILTGKFDRDAYDRPLV